MRQRRLGSFRQLGYRIAGNMGHIPLSLSKRGLKIAFDCDSTSLDDLAWAWKEWLGWSKLHSSDN
jgi:hypothetical protein